jgi:hypothetical protein
MICSTSLEKLAEDKRSSLPNSANSDEEKSVTKLAPGVNVIKLFSFVTDNKA